MALLTFDEIRDYNLLNGGEAHAAWCSRLLTCDGQCTASANYPTSDGQTVTVTVTLHHQALWPTLTYTVDGQAWRFDAHQFSSAVWQAINRQVRRWNEGNAIPDPTCRPKPTGGAL